MSDPENGVPHIPVMLSEVLAALDAGEGKCIVDGTFGAGGYTRAILGEGGSVIAIDRDPDAITNGQTLVEAAQGRLRLVHAPFSQMDEHAQGVDGVVLDIGVSSMQLDQAERGFSFRFDGPLDMRMAQAGLSAADVVNRYKWEDLARIFGLLGEERQAGRIARMIEKRRADRPFERTADLASSIELYVGRKHSDKIHPATRVFQALRIYVNDELGELARALLAAERILKPGGRLVVVTFHSLEDRLVKRFFADRGGKANTGSRHLPQVAEVEPQFEKVSRAIAASDAEIEINPRSRSAKLRSATRTSTDAPAREDYSVFGLPDLSKVGQTKGR